MAGPHDLTQIERLLARDASDAMDLHEFDDELWLAVSALVGSAEDVDHLPPRLGAYFISRYLDWDAQNGGIGQVLYNSAELMDRAPKAFSAVGLPDHAALFTDVAEWAAANGVEVDRAHGAQDRWAGYRELAEHPELERFDARFADLIERGPDSDAIRIEFIRADRGSLVTPDPG